MDRHLLEQLYQAYYQELYIYIYSYCHSRQASEDILQETFLKAILSLSDQHKNMRAWLYKVARNLCINALKREKLQSNSGKMKEIVLENESENPLSKLLQDEQYRLLYEAISRLNRTKREVLLMQYFGRLSQKEIASVLHMTPENVRVTANRARKELRKYLEEEENDLS